MSRGRRKSLEKKRNVFSLDLKTARESLLRTVCGSEFQAAGAEHRNALPNKRDNAANVNVTESAPLMCTTQKILTSYISKPTNINIVTLKAPDFDLIFAQLTANENQGRMSLSSIRVRVSESGKAVGLTLILD